jgi:shikimate kinase
VKRHIVLVGLPGSGKTTVGHHVADILGTTLTDLDETVATAAGCSVSEIFASQGEAQFRTLERAAMDRALAASPHVIAPGAGWIAVPGNLDASRGAQVIYLRVSVDQAALRLTGDASRPLLAGADRIGRIGVLLEERERWYLRATSQVDGSGPAALVAEAVARIARAEAGW